MTTTEVCEYIMDLDKKYQQACFDVQEAWEIFQDILRDDAAEGEGWLVPKDRIDAWIKKVPVMSSSRCVRNVFKIDPHEDYRADREKDPTVLPDAEEAFTTPLTCRVCGKEAKGVPEGLRKYHSGYCLECSNPHLANLLEEKKEVPAERLTCKVCGKTATDLPEGLKKYYMGCAECFNPYLNPNLSEQLRGKI